MSQSDEQLVQMITQQVLAVLRERGLAAGHDQAVGCPANETGQLRAEIHAPIGVCTGDYSKFPELRGRLNASPPPTGYAAANTAAANPATPASQPQVASDAAPIMAKPVHAVLSGVVTAAQLQAAIEASSDGIARVAREARLTPLANDFARKSPEKVQRLDRQDAASVVAVSDAEMPWVWWIDGQCPAVQRVTSERRGRMAPSGGNRSPHAIAQVVRDVAGAIKAGRAAGGFLFVHNAARAICLANRCASIRAVVGTCGEAVEQGIVELGANVLVVEYPHVGPRSMAEMVDRMMQQAPQVPANVQRDLSDLHRCG